MTNVLLFLCATRASAGPPCGPLLVERPGSPMLYSRGSSKRRVIASLWLARGMPVKIEVDLVPVRHLSHARVGWSILLSQNLYARRGGKIMVVTDWGVATRRFPRRAPPGRWDRCSKLLKASSGVLLRYGRPCWEQRPSHR